MWPSRGTDPDSRGTSPRLRVHAEAARDPQQPGIPYHQPLVGRRGRQPVDGGLGLGHVTPVTASATIQLLVFMADAPTSAISNRNPPRKIGTYKKKKEPGRELLAVLFEIRNTNP
jgi:hypothetical protein